MVRRSRWGYAVLALMALIGAGVVALAPTAPASAGPPPFVFVDSVTTGDYHSCVHFSDDTVKCWGLNTLGPTGSGELGSLGDEPGEMGTALPTVAAGTVESVSAGPFNTCAIRTDDSVKCWGSNVSGQLGQGNTTNVGNADGDVAALPAIDLDLIAPPVDVAVGRSHACAMAVGGSVKCWGDNFAGGLGLGDTADRGDGAGEMGSSLPAVDLNGAAIQIAAGDGHTCAVLSGGLVKCWGQGIGGRLGYENNSSRGDGAGEMGGNLPSVDLGTGRTALDVVAGAEHTCALLDDQTVKCWGSNTFGQLGQGSTDALGNDPDEMGDDLDPVDLGPGADVIDLIAGSFHTCAILDGGAVKCWGYNYAGQLGIGDTADRGDGPGEMGANLPTVALGTGAVATWIDAGMDHTCVVIDLGIVKCWGLGNGGQLGYGGTVNKGDHPDELGDVLPPVNLDAADPVPTCDGQAITVDLNRMQVPTTGADVILGEPRGDVIDGLGGIDRICGGAGEDTLTGGVGHDRVFGNAGLDRLSGGVGNDRLDGGSANDRLFGQVGNDSLRGSIGNDLLDGGDGSDTALGAAGIDNLQGRAGDDVLQGGDGADRLFGAQGNDRLSGQGGNDLLDGSLGQDRLDGGPNRDDCRGGPQADVALACEVRAGIP